jgi:hypothetical protein
MVILSFQQRATGIEILRLATKNGEGPRVLSGEVSWLDYNAKPFSAALGHDVSLYENPEEWARCLPAILDSNVLTVTIITDDPGLQLPLPSTSTRAAPAPAPTKGRWGRRRR